MRQGVRFSLALVASLPLLTGCAETRRSLGEDCLKDNDCLSGTCVQLQCAASATTTNARAVAEAATEASSEPPADAAAETPGSAE